jgi:hypothetical protein
MVEVREGHQYLMDQDGNKVGEISSTIIGERILIDSDGNTVCKFVKGRDGLNIVPLIRRGAPRNRVIEPSQIIFI